jgi:hypothetical protein
MIFPQASKFYMFIELEVACLLKTKHVWLNLNVFAGNFFIEVFTFKSSNLIQKRQLSSTLRHLFSPAAPLHNYLSLTN